MIFVDLFEHVLEKASANGDVLFVSLKFLLVVDWIVISCCLGR